MSGDNKKPRGYWKDPDNIINEIKLLNEQGISLNSKSIDQYNSSLRTVARKVFGSWDKAIQIAGLNYSGIKKTKERSKENIIVELKNRINRGLPINQRSLMKDDIALFSASVSYFGTFGNAIEACGIDYSSIKAHEEWTKEKIFLKLRQRKENGLLLNMASIQQEDSHLYSAIFRHFGNFEKMFQEIGIDYNQIKKLKYWTKEEIIGKLQKRYESNLPLNSTFLEKNDNSLYTACRNHFGDYETALKQADINYDQVREDTKMINYYGYKFEDIVEDILKDLNLKYTKKFNTKYQPDFVLNNNCWLDAKLSEWTVYKSKTIEKYEPMCSMLTIVYLRGDKESDFMFTQKTRMMSVFKLIKQLPRTQRLKYSEILKSLWEEANQLTISKIDEINNQGNLVLTNERVQV